MQTRQVPYTITINQQNVTKDLAPYITSIRYTDHMQGVASELEVRLDNADKRFSNNWFISPGQIVALSIDNIKLGNFTIDENGEEASKGDGHTAHFSAQSSGYTPHIRSKTSFTHSGKKLIDIVKFYADKHSLMISGTPPDLNLDVMIQTRESDIDFLHRLGRMYGCIVSLKGSVLVFDAFEDVWARAASKKLHLSDEMSYSFTSSLADSPDGAVNLHNDATNETVIGSGTKGPAFVSGKSDDNPFNKTLVNNWQIPQSRGYGPLDTDYIVPSVFSHIDYRKVASQEEATRMTMGKVLNGMLNKFTCTITMPGDIYCVAGNLIDIQEVGKRSGLWLIDTSIHTLNKKGEYVTVINGNHGLTNNNDRAVPAQTTTPNINSPRAKRDFFAPNEA